MIKRLAVFVGGVIGVFLLIGGGCGFAGWKMMGGILDNRSDIFGRWFPAVRWCTNGLPLIDKLDKILNGTYIILLQNNTELRATGGFMGSYARVKFVKGGLASVFVQDIYQPDGQLPGHVEPPYPVQEAFGTGYWKLRDSNWDPDFASSAADVKWFLEQGGEENIDGIMAVNLDFLKQWLAVMGGVKVITFNEKVTDKNLYTLAQSQAEIGWTEGSTHKRDFLGAVGTALIERTRGAKMFELIKLMKLMIGELNKKQILIWTENKDIESDIQRVKWDGKLTTGWDGRGDYVYLVDSNTGSNKADCCIKRTIVEEVESNGQTKTEDVSVTWQNKNEFSAAKPPVFWGGDYFDYVRVVVPNYGIKIMGVNVGGKDLRLATEDDFKIPNSQRQGRSWDMYVVDQRKESDVNSDLQIIGFWVKVVAQESTTAKIKLTSIRNPINGYKVFVKRQPGVESLGYKLVVDGKIRADKVLDSDSGF